jgi:hypothetical protein
MLKPALPRADRNVAQNVAAPMRARFATPGTLILAISAVAAISIFLTTDAMYFSDSNSYLIYSFAISHFSVEPGVFYRQAGYPLLITATLCGLLRCPRLLHI